MITTLITAVISFVSTNIDDIFVLMLFFSQVNGSMKKRHIVIGQYIGIGILTSISIIGAFGMSIIPQQYVGLLGLMPIYIGFKAWVDHRKENNQIEDLDELVIENDKISVKENRIVNEVKNLINPNIIKVASVTIANGGDNIGIYIPFFRVLSLENMLITVVVFSTLVAFWCYIALKLAGQSFIQKSIDKYSHVIVPLVFIGLGIYILLESGTVSFIIGGK